MNIYSFLYALLALFAAQILRTYLATFREGALRYKTAYRTTWILYLLLQYIIATSDSEFNPLILVLANILLMTLIQVFAGSGDFRTALFRSGILGASWMAAEIVSQGILLLAKNDDSFLAGNLISKIAMYVVVQMYRRWRGRDRGVPLPFIHWVELFLIPLSSMIIIYYAYLIDLQNGTHTFFSLVSVLMVLINYTIFDIYEKLGTQTLIERQNRAYAQEINLCVRQAADREEAYQQTRTLRHDLKGRLVALSALLEAGQTENAKREIEKMLAENSLNRNGIAETGNLALDALINYKYDAALSEGIRMECCLETPAELFVDGTDLCVILGNLLDNALEAVQKIPEEAKRWINLTVRLSKSALFIIVENPCTGEVTTDSQGRLKSQKTGDHGIGLLSVERTAKKYAGALSVQHEDEIFQASVMLVQQEI